MFSPFCHFLPVHCFIVKELVARLAQRQKGKFIKMANISTNEISPLQGQGFVKRKYCNGS